MTTFLMPHRLYRTAAQNARARLSLTLALLTACPAWASCSASSSGLSFGPYQPLTMAGQFTSADVLSTGTISISCNSMPSPRNYTLALGASAVGGGDGISTRYMANSNGGPNMAFNIYTDASRSIVWGNGSNGALVSGSLPNVSVGSYTESVTVYGKIPAGQNTLKAGLFSGLVTVTLTYNP
jgi:spore coat protein U-like protein